MNKKVHAITLALAIIGLIFSVLILIEKNSYTTVSNFCSAVTGPNSCATVQGSAYSTIFGISNPIYGIIGFAVLIVFSIILMNRRNNVLYSLTNIGCIAAGVLSLWFLYVQTFLLHTYCALCLVVDAASLVLLGITLYVLLHKKNPYKHK